MVMRNKNYVPRNCKECVDFFMCNFHCYGSLICKYRKEIEEKVIMKMENECKDKILLKVNERDVRDILQKMGDTFAVKNVKYGSSFEISVDKYGMIAALTRISDKFNRIENLILTNDKGTDDESVMDTLIDMANYCVMTAVYVKNAGTKSKGEE